MLKTGIYGADTRIAGELIRLLINHPDVDIRQLYAPAYKGEDASRVHHGLMGERVLKFTDRFDPTVLDVIFICRSDDYTESLLAKENELESNEIDNQSRKHPLRIIEMSGRHTDDYMESALEYGLSEINRKGLVRGARRGVVPRAESSLTLASIYPIAAHLLLSGDIELEFDLPVSYISESDVLKAAEDIRRQLSKIQTSFRGAVAAKVRESESKRAMRMRVTLPMTLSQTEIERIYDSIYDDHNFTWVIAESPDIKEVEGTHKCIVGLIKSDSDDTLTIDAVADCRMRGGAGEAVHLMNLLCGLHERTGLRMKSTAY